ncbi:MAG: hypothetical protein A2Z32_07260 [Chloroflexi bacterium RBG_16_69_14]|nr:MAG: hypothetical protein A2Z32_07260 [Chloroflexi bacterium RBG_16_69_14]
MPASPGERIRATLTSATSEPALARHGRPYALGWATVELDRAARELAADLGLAADAFAPAADSLALGARCRVAHVAIARDVALAILEPATEGRLAGMLARLGEGPAVIWLVAGDTVAADRPAATPGPFGPERLMPGGPIRGLRWFLIGPAAGTIPP